jgi:hypothetical protein
MNVDLFNMFMMSLYSQRTKELILKKTNDTALKRILTDYTYDIENSMEEDANIDLKKFFSVVTPEIRFLHLLRELGYNQIRKLMIDTKDLTGDLNLLSKIHHYLGISCLTFFNDNGNYYHGVNNYYDYDINDNNIVINTTTEVLELSIPDINKENPEIIMVQRDDNTTAEALAVKAIISNPDYEKILNVDNINKTNATNIKSLKDTIVYNNKKYKLDANLIISDDNKYYNCIYYKNKQYIATETTVEQSKWSNDIEITKSNSIISVYVLSEEAVSSQSTSSKSYDKFIHKSSSTSLSKISSIIKNTSNSKSYDKFIKRSIISK